MSKLTEAQIQRTLWQHYQARKHPHVWGFAVPNGIRSNPIAIRNAKLQGFVPGVPDLIFCREGFLLAMELKKEGGRPSLNQLEQADMIRNAGGCVVIAEGLSEGIKCLETWQIIRA